MEEGFIQAQIGKFKGTGYKMGFWVIIIFLAGFLSGVTFAQHFIIYPKMKEATRLQGVIIDNKVFDLKERVGQ